VQERKSLEGVEAVIDQLNVKHTEMSAKLADIDAALNVAEKEQQEAVVRYARGEITEEQLENYPVNISSLKEKRSVTAAALDVVEKDIAAAKVREKEISEQIRGQEAAAWRMIGEIELAKAAMFLRRAFAAFDKGGACPMADPVMRKKEFLRRQVYEATFCVSDKDYMMVIDKMAQEYLK
jgi:hypothetical protein